ncbi:MAG TPA: isoaspartyl peptidase/L-asparaginase [Thermoanaerobaculia bacterium]|nr:isoaspartyl peptidase/L-asparaginase [Thermoanaerobaculia bacterium]
MSARREWAVAVHGGAGSMPEERLAGREPLYLASLERAVRLGATMLGDGASSLDTVEAVVRLLEEDPLFNAGKGAVYNHEGTHELDASIMEGRGLRCGAVAGVRTVRNPVTLARLVMERTPHVFLAGEGAEAFAREAGVEIVEPSFFDTPGRREELERELAKSATSGSPTPELGTVGAVALDRAGDVAAATSTGGRTNKRYGRVGDVPVIGAGTYADNRTGAISATGKGEEMIRHAAAANVSARVEHAGAALEDAVREVVHQVLEPGDGGMIAVSPDGVLVLDFNTEGMFRGAADSAGRFEVAIRSPARTGP